jgi:glycolate oxidase iron-sulfur subunit
VTSPDSPNSPEPLARALDRCVKCGLCLPECPTYRLAGDENESPRGRISLMEGLVAGHLRADRALRGHLESCLTCRRCERVCPSGVRYGALIDEVRGRIGARHGRQARWIQRPALQRLGTGLARRLPAAVSRPFGPLHRLHRLARALPDRGGAPPSGEYPASAGARGVRVGLFPGCASAAQQGGALQAALELLRASGFDVVVPAKAGCCGALSAHSGDAAHAAALAGANRAAFDRDLAAVVSVASGCGIHLDAYAPPLGPPHHDVSAFLLAEAGLTAADFRPYPGPVLLHTPCSMENVYRGGDQVARLLALIRGLQIVPLGTPGHCCGSAGDHMLRRPGRAARLRAPLIADAAASGAGVLLTSNVGCAMHLADGLQSAGLALEVMHPVEFLARLSAVAGVGAGTDPDLVQHDPLPSLQ